MHTRLRAVQWSMKRKKLPQSYRQRWAATTGEWSCATCRKGYAATSSGTHLCRDLVRLVLLFQHVDKLVLENICDRVTPLVFPNYGRGAGAGGRDADAAHRRGQLLHAAPGTSPATSCCRGACAARVASSATLETTEAFGLDAAYVMTRHFRYTFADVWSAAQRAVLLARVVHVGRARRYKHRKTPASLSLSKPLSSCASHGEDKLRRYAAILASPKPNQDDEF
jgi:cyclic nucleotide gated channel, plant